VEEARSAPIHLYQPRQPTLLSYMSGTDGAVGVCNHRDSRIDKDALKETREMTGKKSCAVRVVIC
jgi:hypothetical protein